MVTTKPIWAALLIALASTAPVAHEMCDIVRGATVIAQDDESTVLGKITHEYDAQSIFNEYGLYGSEYQTNSMWNQYGQFGSPYATYSANNPYATRPPMIIKRGKVVGYISTNKNIKASVAPNLLKALCKDEM